MNPYTKCAECSSENLTSFEKPGELVCLDCGLVLDESRFDQNPYVSEVKKGYARMPYLATAGSSHIDGRIVKKGWLHTTKEKNLHRAKRKIELIASRLKLPDFVITEAKTLYKLALDRDLNIGRDNQSILYACVYSACNICGVPKTAFELTAYTSMNKTKMLRAMKLLKQELGLSIGIVDPLDLVPRFASRLNLKQETTTLAIEIISKIKGTSVTQGRNPQTIVASALYLASKLNKDDRTQRDIANTTGVIEVTIRKRSKEIIQILETQVIRFKLI